MKENFDVTDPEIQKLINETVAKMNIPLATMFTCLGERVIKKVEGKQVLMPYEVAEYPEEKLSDELHEGVENIFSGSTQIYEDIPNRQVPLTRKEVYENLKLTKQTLKKLIKKDLLKERLVTLKRLDNGRSERAQAVVYLTALGRGYTAKFFDEKYFEKVNDCQLPLPEGRGLRGDLQE